MEVKQIAKSCFLLTESTGTVVAVNPFDDIFDKILQEKIDVVTLSNPNRLNSKNKEFLEKNGIQVIDTEGVFDTKGVYISSINTASEGDNTPCGKTTNLVFKFRLDGVDICHLGNVVNKISIHLLETIGSVNILILPIGGHKVIDADEAFEYVENLMPDVVIPTKFRNKEYGSKQDRIDDFIDLFESDSVEFANSNSKQFSRVDFDKENTKIVVLN